MKLFSLLSVFALSATCCIATSAENGSTNSPSTSSSNKPTARDPNSIWDKFVEKNQREDEEFRQVVSEQQQTTINLFKKMIENDKNPFSNYVAENENPFNDYVAKNENPFVMYLYVVKRTLYSIIDLLFIFNNRDCQGDCYLVMQCCA